EQAYYTIPLLFKELEGERKFENVPGLAYKKNGNIIVTAHPQEIDFDKFPNPARHLLPNELYAEFPTQRKNFTVMVTSLGCPMQCGFCEAGGTLYCARSAETVVNEMEECSGKFNIREIDFFDYEFTAVQQRVLDICSKIKDRKLNIKWACRSRVDRINEKLLHEMKSAGCSRIYFGIESGSQEILENVHKKITLNQVKDAVGMAKGFGIQTLGFFLIGAPGETRGTVKETVRFARQLGLDYVQFSKCLAKPLTGLWKEMVKNSGEDYWKDWVLGRELDRSLPRPWTQLTNQEIDNLTKRAYISFYCRPLFLFRAVRKVRSFKELRRKFMAFLDMLFRQENVSHPDSGFLAYNENLPVFVKNRIDN
ncbi:MAG: radical SAM protein, partial [Spirochaetota bacterium]